jgi:hypothetical protein
MTGALSLALAGTAAAQSTTKTEAKIHHALKKAGNTIKQDAGEVGSATHKTLKKAGNDTKTALGKATGIHKVGGDVGKAAQSVSHAGKRAGTQIKHTTRQTAASAHHTLTRIGKQTKAKVDSTVKKPQ